MAPKVTTAATTTTTTTTTISKSHGSTPRVVHQYGFYFTIAICVFSFLQFVIGASLYSCKISWLCFSVVISAITFFSSIIDIIIRVSNIYPKIHPRLRSALVNIIIYTVGGLTNFGCSIVLLVRSATTAIIFMGIFELLFSLLLLVILAFWIKLAMQNRSINVFINAYPI